MPDLLTRPLLRRDEPAWGSRVPWLAALLGAGWALVAGLALCTVPTVAVWIGDGAAAALGEPLRLGGRVWLLAHHVGLEVGAATFSVPPLGVTILLALLMHRSARWAAHSSGVASRADALHVIAVMTLTYVVGAGVVAGVTRTPDAAAAPIEAVAWAGLLALGASTIGVAVESGLHVIWLDRIAPEVRAVLAGAGVAIAGVVASGALLVVVSAIANSDRVGQLATALDAGVLGTTVLAVASAAFVPNTVLWGAAFALGPGFSVGTATSVAPGGVELSLVPALPVLGALPAEVPGWSWVVLALPVAAGVLAGFVVDRRLTAATPEATPTLQTTALAALGAGLIAMFGLALLTFAAAGSAGADRLTQVGAVPGQVAVAALALVAVPAVATATLLCWRGPAEAPVDSAVATDTEATQDSADG